MGQTKKSVNVSPDTVKVSGVQPISFDWAYGVNELIYEVNFKIEGEIWKCHIPEKNLKTKRLYSAVEEASRARYGISISFVSEEEEETLIVKAIKEMAREVNPLFIPACGGWSTLVYPNLSRTLIYTPPQNHLRRKQVYDYYVKNGKGVAVTPASLIVKARQYDFFASIRYIKNQYDRVFLCLYIHYCYLAGRFSRRPDEILCIGIANNDLRAALKNYLLGDYYLTSCETVSTSETMTLLNQMVHETTGMPLVLFDNGGSGGRNTIKAKIGKLASEMDLGESILVSGRQTYNRQRSRENPWVPIVFARSVPKLENRLIHIYLDSDAMEKGWEEEEPGDFINWFTKEYGAYYDYFFKLEEEYQKQKHTGVSEMQAVISSVYLVLKEIQKEKKCNLDEKLGFDGDLDSLFKRVLPTLEEASANQCEDIISAAKRLIEDGAIGKFCRKSNVGDQLVSVQELNNEACVFLENDTVLFNDRAMELIANAVPSARNKSMVLSILERHGKLVGSRVNEAAYGNKLVVHTSDETKVNCYLYQVKINMSSQTKKNSVMHYDGPVFDLGKDSDGQSIQWYFDDPNHANKHMLITGKSGSGKSFLLQELVLQASKQGIMTIVIHLQGDVRKDILEIAERVDLREIKPDVWDVDWEHDRKEITSLFKRSLQLTESQTVKLMHYCEEYYQECEEQGKCPTLAGFVKSVSVIMKKSKHTSLPMATKIKNIADSELFRDSAIDWGANRKKTIVLDFSSMSEEENIRKIQTEALLWDVYRYKEKHKNEPVVLVVDEFHTLEVAKTSMLGKILSEGRKYGWSMWLGTQLLNQKGSEVLKQFVDQASMQIYFDQGVEGNRNVAKRLAADPKEREQTRILMGSLQKRQFLIKQDAEEPRVGLGIAVEETTSEVEV